MNTLDLLKLTQDQKTEGIWLLGIEGEGEYLEWWENGRLFMKVFYENGKRHGEYSVWHKNGRLSFKSFFKDDKEISFEYFRST